MSNQNMSFLPEGYELPVSSGAAAFLQMPKDGDSIKFAVLGQLVAGWFYWNESKQCFRSREKFEETPNIKKGDKQRHFWAFPVLVVETGEVKILEVTQSTVQGTLHEIATGGDWNIIGGCVLKISRIGKTMNDTKYTVMPIPPTEEVNSKYKAALADKENWPNMEELLFAPPKEAANEVDTSKDKEIM